MTRAKNPIPEGLRTITPQLVVKGAVKAIEFYKKAFGATEINRMLGPGGTIAHATLSIGDSRFFLNDEMAGEHAGSAPTPMTRGTVVLNLYVADCDKTFKQAIDAGAKVSMPLADQFWGDRYGQVTDPYGHVWAIGTHKEDLSLDEVEERGRQFFESTTTQR